MKQDPVECKGRNPVILILDRHCQEFPWESMTCLRDQPVSRMPSMSFVLSKSLEAESVSTSHVIPRDGVDVEKTFFVLNPGVDLTGMQEAMTPVFE